MKLKVLVGNGRKIGLILNIHIKSPDVNEADLEKVAGLAEEKYCPVWSMIKGNVVIKLEHIISK